MMVTPATEPPAQTLTNVKLLPVTNSHSVQIPLAVSLVNVITDSPVTDISVMTLMSVKLTPAILMHLVIMNKVFFIVYLFIFIQNKTLYKFFLYGLYTLYSL